MSHLRILQVNSLLSGGGTDHQCLELVRGLGREGHAVRIYGPAGAELSPGARSLGEFVVCPGRASSPGFFLRMVSEIRRWRAHVVHAHHGRDYWPTILACRMAGRGTACVLTRHLAKSPSGWGSRRFLTIGADAIIAVSGFVKRVLTEGVMEPDAREAERRRRPPLMGNRSGLRVVYPGIDVSAFAPRPSEPLRGHLGFGDRQVVFGVVGGYSAPRGKGQREFLAAAARVREANPDARFVIVGRGNLRETLESDIARHGLDGVARLTGQMEDMPALMNALDVLVHPAIGTEAFGLVLAEAMACGKPVIASSLDGLPEVFENRRHGLLVPADDVEALAEAMRELAADRDRRGAMGRAAREHVVGRFSSERLAVKTLEVYREFLTRRGINP